MYAERPLERNPRFVNGGQQQLVGPVVNTRL